MPHTPYELAVELTRRIGLGSAESPSITTADCELALAWCCAATQEGSKAGESMLVFTLGAVTDDSDVWMDW